MTAEEILKEIFGKPEITEEDVKEALKEMDKAREAYNNMKFEMK